MTTVSAEKLAKMRRGKISRARGDHLEAMALRHLAARGILAQRIATPCLVSRGRKIFTSKVVGDLVGCTNQGRAVLVECKNYTDAKGTPRRPRLSDFLPHQRETLTNWDKAGALVLVAYLTPAGSLTVEDAQLIISPKGPTP